MIQIVLSEELDWGAFDITTAPKVRMLHVPRAGEMVLFMDRTWVVQQVVWLTEPAPGMVVLICSKLPMPKH